MPADVPPLAVHTPGQPGAAPRKRRRRFVPPGLLRREAAAHYCGAGASTWDRWAAAGLTPAPIKLGGSVCWSRVELAAWIAHGCPVRQEWEPVWRQIVARRDGRAK